MCLAPGAPLEPSQPEWSSAPLPDAALPQVGLSPPELPVRPGGGFSTRPPPERVVQEAGWDRNRLHPTSDTPRGLACPSGQPDSHRRAMLHSDSTQKISPAKQ